MSAFRPNRRAAGRAKPAGLPNWIMTFADLMTLLLTFFILMLSFSVMDAERYKAIAEALGEAFGGRQSGNTPVTLTAEPMPVPSPLSMDNSALAAPPEATPAPASLPPMSPEARAEGELAAQLIEALENEIAQQQVSVSYNTERVIMRFAEDATFPSGSADLIASTRPILDKVVEVLAQCDGNIIVSGHSDDLPVQSARFRSNWDLSSARAVSVVHALVLNRQIDASRVVAAGRAETRPLMPNDSAANRARNRRVEIEIVNPRCR